MTPDVIRHLPRCAAPDDSEVDEFTGRLGDPIRRCRRCLQYLIVRGERRQLTDPGATRYRCRVHHEQPVTWRGTGCPDCPPRHRKRRKPRPVEAAEWEATQ